MNAPEDRPLVFALSKAATGREPTILGLWTMTSSPSVGGLAFTAEPATRAGQAVVWRVDLPANPEGAAARLETAEASLSAYPKALATAETRMDAYAEQRQAAVGLSFGPISAAGPAERRLDSLLLEIAQGRGTASYGLLEAVGGELVPVTARFQAFLDGLARQLSHYAWIETRDQGQLLACTVVGWTGDARTYWRAGMASSRMAMHRQALALALDSRLRLLQTVAFVSRNALRLARLPILLGVPGGAILALPLAWKFVDDVRRELDR